MNVDSHDFRGVQAEDLPVLISLLKDCALPSDDLSSVNMDHFELALEANGRVVGLAGLEVSGSNALLRSVSVLPDWRGQRLGETLVNRREKTARAVGVTAVYLLTTTAADFFRRLGYADVARDAVPAAITAHAQFRSLCPASATCLVKRLK